jgi:hypothetical protein
MGKTKDSDYVVGKNLEMGGKKVDLSNVQDLFDEDQMMEEINPEELQYEDAATEKKEGMKNKKGKPMRKEEITAEEEA